MTDTSTKFSAETTFPELTALQDRVETLEQKRAQKPTRIYLGASWLWAIAFIIVGALFARALVLIFAEPAAWEMLVK